MAISDSEWELVGLPVVERAKREILKEITAGHIPAAVTSFAELHDFCDANEFGGAFETDEDGISWWDGDEQQMEASIEFWNRVQNEVDEWLKAGRK